MRQATLRTAIASVPRSTVSLVLADLSADLTQLERDLLEVPEYIGHVELKDGSRRLRVHRNGTGQQSKGLLVCDPALAFSKDGDPLWAFDRFENDRRWPAVVVARRQIIERAFMEALAQGHYLTAIRAGRLLVEADPVA